jgi:hypothetical protein
MFSNANRNNLIKLMLIILFSLHIYYNVTEHFTAKPINWRDTSLDKEEVEDEGPKIEQKYMEVAEHGYEAGKYDIQYHETNDKIEEKNKDDYNYDYIKIIDKNNKETSVRRLRIQSKILFKNPIDYKYGITPYIPSYTDTVLLSRLRK